MRLRDRGARLLELCLRLFEVRARLPDLRLRDGRVELRNDLPLLDLRVEVGVERGDRSRRLAADLHGRDGLQRAGRRDCVAQVAPLDLRSHVLGCARVIAPEPESRERDNCRRDEYNGESFPRTQN